MFAKLRLAAKGTAAVAGAAASIFVVDHLRICRNLHDKREVVKPNGQSVVVLGGGIVGVASAARLAQAGFRVTLLERSDTAGLGASNVNAGGNRPSTYSPIVEPSTLWKLIRTWSREQATQCDYLRAFLDVDFWRWAVRFLIMVLSARTEGTPQGDFLLHHGRAFVDAMYELAKDEGLQPPLRHTECLNVYVCDGLLPKKFESGRRKAARANARGYGTLFEVVHHDEVLQLEPSLKSLAERGRLRGGLRCPQDESGHSGEFARSLAARIAELHGVELRYGSEVTKLVLDASGEKLQSVRTATGENISADFFVMSMGSASQPLLRQIGIYLPLYPVKGYSLTFPSDALSGLELQMEMLCFPQLGTYVTQFRDADESHRIRFISVLEWAGWDDDLKRPASVEALRGKVKEIYPQISEAAFQRAEVGVGSRPWTVDDLPIVSGTYCKNLYINTGHGHYGFRMSAATADQLLCLMTGREPPLEQELLSLTRFRSLWRQEFAHGSPCKT